ncbi:hypothetical protein D3C80_2120260 [compost metagenome]
MCFNINVTVPIQVFNYRDTGFIADPFNQPFASTWNNHIDKFSECNQLPHGCAVCGVNDLNRMFR